VFGLIMNKVFEMKKESEIDEAFYGRKRPKEGESQPDAIAYSELIKYEIRKKP
jgi:hypothetical protein